MSDHTSRYDIQAGNPFHALIGVELVERGDGYARCRLPVTEKVRGGVGGSVHGGVLSTLADIATIAAVSTQVRPDEEMAGTAELNISYLRPALGAAVFVAARVIKKGRSLAVCDVDLTDPSGRLLAKSRVTYALRRREPADSAPGRSGRGVEDPRDDEGDQRRTETDHRHLDATPPPIADR
jgi:uncharacterized protein (TIGR00369 family)